MKLRSRSLTLASAIALSAVSLGPVIAQTPSPQDACSGVRVPKDMICMVSPKTGKPVAVLTACAVTVSAVSFPAGTNPLKTGISLNGGPVCKIDPKTDLPMVALATDRPLKKPINHD